LLIVDEPTAGLDPEERIRFRTLLSDLAGDRTVLLSTHIVEDIAQTCRYLAVLVRGRVIFQGTTLDLIDTARGSVWTVTTAGEKPQGNVTLVSAVPVGTGTRYRVVGEPSPSLRMELAEPSLEDGYVWLMRRHRLPVVAAT
jgi:ABC-type multidrug transport system ATPase subunit